MSSLRKTLNFLVSELDVMAEKYEQDTHLPDLTDLEKRYRGGKAAGLLIAVRKMRDALVDS